MLMEQAPFSFHNEIKMLSNYNELNVYTSGSELSPDVSARNKFYFFRSGKIIRPYKGH